MNDAQRYQWIRRRLQIRHERAMSGSTRPAFSLRIGHSFLDSGGVPGSGYLDPARYEAELAEVDAAIDAAIGRETPPSQECSK